MQNQLCNCGEGADYYNNNKPICVKCRDNEAFNENVDVDAFGNIIKVHQKTKKCSICAKVVQELFKCNKHLACQSCRNIIWMYGDIFAVHQNTHDSQTLKKCSICAKVVEALFKCNKYLTCEKCRDIILNASIDPHTKRKIKSSLLPNGDVMTIYA
jgi:hypothetical protein